MADHKPSRDIQFSNTNLTADQRSPLADEYRHLFVGPDGKLGKCDIVRNIMDVDPAQRPIKHRAYRLAPQQKDAMEKILKDLEEQDIIEQSVGPWSAPCLLVAKKNNNGFRFVVDYRSLNRATIHDAHPLPTPNEALESLGASKPTYFTTLDLAQGFYQLVIDPESRPYTAFRCHLGLFSSKVGYGIKE